MKINVLVMSLAVVGMLFASCDDTKKKEAEATAEAEQIELETRMEAEQAAAAEAAQIEFDNNTIAAIAAGNENFSTLVAALVQAGLVETFMGEGEFTVFAPTNDAFGALPTATLEDLMKVENKEQLQNLLKYHVVAGEWKSDALIKAISENNNKYNVTTLQGENIVLSIKDDKVVIEDAKGNTATVVQADVDASNGVIHAIDKVVMTKGK